MKQKMEIVRVRGILKGRKTIRFPREEIRKLRRALSNQLKKLNFIYFYPREFKGSSSLFSRFISLSYLASFRIVIRSITVDEREMQAPTGRSATRLSVTPNMPESRPKRADDAIIPLSVRPIFVDAAAGV